MIRVIGQQLALAAQSAVIFVRDSAHDNYLKPWGGSVKKLVTAAAEAEGLVGKIETLSDTEHHRAVSFRITKPFQRQFNGACALQNSYDYDCQVQVPVQLNFEARSGDGDDNEAEDDKKPSKSAYKYSYRGRFDASDDDDNSSSSKKKDKKSIEPEALSMLPLADVKAYGTNRMQGSLLPLKSGLAKTSVDWHHVSLHTLLLLNPTPYHRRQLFEMLLFQGLAASASESPRILVHQAHLADAQFVFVDIAGTTINERDSNTNTSNKADTPNDIASKTATPSVVKPAPSVRRVSTASVVGAASDNKDANKPTERNAKSDAPRYAWKLDEHDRDDNDNDDKKSNKPVNDDKRDNDDKGGDDIADKWKALLKRNNNDDGQDTEVNKNTKSDDEDKQASSDNNAGNRWKEFVDGKPNDADKKAIADKMAYLEKLKDQEPSAGSNRRGLKSIDETDSTPRRRTLLSYSKGSKDQPTYWWDQTPTPPAPPPSAAAEAPVCVATRTSDDKQQVRTNYCDDRLID
jgi:hypothetical protein